MNIHFCDVCAARVSDHDLSRGVGIRKGDVVICGTCIDAGHGAELLAQVERSASVRTPALVGSGALDQLRDRVATQPDPIPAEVDAVELADPAPEPSAALAASDEVPVDARDETAVNPILQVDGINAMASGLSALGGRPPVRSDAAEDILEEAEEDLELDVEDDDEPVPQAEAFAEDPADEKVASHAPVDEVAISDHEVVDPSPPEAPPVVEGDWSDESNKDETCASPILPDGEGKKAKRSSSSQRARSASSSSSTTRRKVRSSGLQAKSPSGVQTQPGRSSTKVMKSTRRVAARRGPSPAVFWTASGVTLGILLLLVIWAGSGGIITRSRDGGQLNVSQQLGNDIARAKTQAIEAYRSNDPQRMRQAVATLHSLSEKARSYETTARAAGHSDAEIGRTLQVMGLNDARSMIRTLNDKIVELSNR